MPALETGDGRILSWRIVGSGPPLLALEHLDLLGHSHGGFVAMGWGGTYPDLVGRLILADTAPRFTDVIRSRRLERVAAHQGEPYFEDAVAALQDQQAGNYSSDEELAGLYEREPRLLVARRA